MQYAVIRSGGKQYKVSEGDTLTIDKLNQESQSKINFEEVLLAVDGDVVSIGNPLVSGVHVEATLIENKKGDKIRVIRFKAKSRYRKTIGFRAQHTVVKIEKINFGTGKTLKKVTKPAKTTSKAVKK